MYIGTCIIYNTFTLKDVLLNIYRLFIDYYRFVINITTYLSRIDKDVLSGKKVQVRILAEEDIFRSVKIYMNIDIIKLIVNYYSDFSSVYISRLIFDV